jgi:Methyltransferase domain
MHIRPMITGILSCVPGMKSMHYQLSKDKIGDSLPRYSYSVWLRHLLMANRNGILNGVPSVIAELGPGKTLGVGLAGLISGAEKYYGLDVVEYCSSSETLGLFDEIVELFKNKTDIPGESEYPNVKPYLDSYKFPEHIFPNGALEKALDEKRIAKIRNAISLFSSNDMGEVTDKKNSDNEMRPSQALRNKRGGGIISYYVPWHKIKIIEDMTVDMIYSQAVMEHVEDISEAYKTMRLWLKPKGIISHQIDFKSHGTAAEWNGHWGYGDFLWKVIKGGKLYLINRAPHSKHISMIESEDLKIVCDVLVKKTDGIQRHQLAHKFKSLSDEDLHISGAFIQAIK